MKIALYIEDGLEQIVLTPVGDTEKSILGKLHDGSRALEIRRGSFYECVGGWVRQGQTKDSTMIVLRLKRPAGQHPQPEQRADIGEDLHLVAEQGRTGDLD